ncbi:MAG: ATP-binding protein [Microbacterium sp.]
MDPSQLALVALVVGVVIGAGITAVLMVALRARDHARVQASLEIPDGTRAVLQGMDDVALVVDSSLQIAAASAPAELFGMHEGVLLPSGDQGGDELRALVRAARRADDADLAAQVATIRLSRGVGPNAESRLVAARASVITPRLTLVVIRDITESARVEQMRRDFVANTSHELKTPVGAVSLLAEAIESAADDPDQVRNFARRLTAEVTRLGELTSRIMNLSRLQSADEVTEVRDVAVDEIVSAAIASQAVTAEAAGVQIVRGGVAGIHVRGDAQVLVEAIANLIANAVAYSPRGVPEAQVGVGVKLDGGMVSIAVTDRGIGISEADQQRIFERFYRADQARSRRTGGTGLGLSIVKHAVQRHGGEVELWSRPGRGSTFTVRLPLVNADAGVDVTSRARKNKTKTIHKSTRDSARVKGEKRR